MKTEIHPKYHEKSVIRCACGATYAVGSTRESIQIEICANCHPFYTGEEKLIDTAGRVEKFRSRRSKAVEPKAKKVRVKKTS